MHPELFLAIHQERERELVARLERERLMHERASTDGRPHHGLRQTWLAARTAAGALAERAREQVARVDPTHRDVACCATA